MGLSERKNKQRIGNDPRNLTWSDDKSRFSYKHMTTLGWSDTAGIGGRDLSGNPNHIAVARKLDNGGIGMARARKDGDDQAAGAGQAGRSFEDVLKRLAQTSDSTPATPKYQSLDLEAGEDTRREAVRSRVASRQRHLLAKRLASSSPAALSQILGVPVADLPQSSSASPAPQSGPSSIIASPAPLHPSDLPESSTPARSADEVISTSSLSVADYFRTKMRAKSAAHVDSALTATPTPATMDLHPMVKPVIITAVSPPEHLVEVEKSAKKARKEARRLRKLADTEDSGQEAVDVKTSTMDHKVERKRRNQERMLQSSGDAVDDGASAHKRKKRKD